MRRLSLAMLLAGGVKAAGGADYPTPHQVVPYFGSAYVTVEAENFTVAPGAGAVWRPVGWGDGNYFASTLNNVFSSRRALLSGDQHAANAAAAGTSLATATVTVPQRGLFSVLVRFEGLYHFNTGFRVTIAQRGATVFERVYGLRGNLKLWGFVDGRVKGGDVLDIPGSCEAGDLLTAECSWNYVR